MRRVALLSSSLKTPPGTCTGRGAHLGQLERDLGREVLRGDFILVLVEQVLDPLLVHLDLHLQQREPRTGVYTWWASRLSQNNTLTAQDDGLPVQE